MIAPATVEDAPPEVVWKPLPGSQALAVACPCNVLLYEGSRGPGKTDSQVMFFRSKVGKGYGKFWRGVIFDREYKNLDDLISKSERWFPQFKDGARFLRSKSDYKWVWPTGEELLFRQFKKETDYWNYHGQEFPFIGWNELSKFPTAKPFELMASCNRSGFIAAEHTPKDENGRYKTPDGKPLPEMQLIIFATTNPYGPGHGWVKKRFIDPADPGQILESFTNVYNPRTGKREDIKRTQVRLFGSYRENRYLPPEYVAVLESITDPNRRKAWLEGDWNIVAGGMFDDVWRENVHVIDDFKVPKAWRIDRAFDWGSSHPFSVGWYAEANGEAVTLNDGTIFQPRRGSIIRFAEWYGTQEAGTNEGLRMSGPDIAAGIMEREMKMMKAGTISTIPKPGPADGQIYQTTQSDVATIGTKMAAEGVEWIPANKAPGSRINGWQLVRDAMRNAAKGEGAGLYFTKSCRHAIALIPTTPRDEEEPDDVDTLAEDHIPDEVRYKLLDASRKWAVSIKTKHPT